MVQTGRRWLASLAVVALLGWGLWAGHGDGASTARGSGSAQARGAGARPPSHLHPTLARGVSLPLRFVENRGQSHHAVRFSAQGPGQALFLTPREAVLAFGAEGSSAVVGMRAVGISGRPEPVAGSPLAGSTNYFLGDDPSVWVTGARAYDSVRYPDLYEGIDLMFRGGPDGLEYDFVVEPGGDPAGIGLRFRGAEPSLSAGGDVVLETTAGQIVHRAPVAYQVVNGRRELVPAAFDLAGDGTVRFDVGAYDLATRLVIDPPVILYSSYWGGPLSDNIYDIALDPKGNIYVTGDTFSIEKFPLKNAVQDDHGDPEDDINVLSDAFISKLDPAGATMLYSTYLGGANQDRSNSIDVDAQGRATIGGHTFSTNFPTAAASQGALAGAMDGFVAGFAANGLLRFSTYLGGSLVDTGDGYDEVLGVAVTQTGTAFVTGRTKSKNFPTTEDALDRDKGIGTVWDAFVTRFSLGGSRGYSTYLVAFDATDTVGWAIDTNTAGQAVVLVHTGAFKPTHETAYDDTRSGVDFYVGVMKDDGSEVLRGTYLGGTGTEGLGPGLSSTSENDHADIALDKDNNVYVIGSTTSTDFPTTPDAAFEDQQGGSRDAVVAKLDANLSILEWATYLGGSQFDDGRGIAVGKLGEVFVTGMTTSDEDFPVVQPVQEGYGGDDGEGNTDAWAAKLKPDGSGLSWSTYLGGGSFIADDGVTELNQEFGHAVAVDADGDALVVGRTCSSGDFPLVGDSPDNRGLRKCQSNTGDEGFITKIGTSDVKRVTLALSKTLVNPGTPVKLTATILPCAGHARDTIEFRKRVKQGMVTRFVEIATKQSNAQCIATHTVTINKQESFQAFSAKQDADHGAATSQTRTVRIRD